MVILFGLNFFLLGNPYVRGGGSSRRRLGQNHNFWLVLVGFVQSASQSVSERGVQLKNILSADNSTRFTRHEEANKG